MTVLPQLERDLRAAHDRHAPGRRARPGRARRRLSTAVPAIAVAVAVAVVAVFAGIGGTPPSRPTAPTVAGGLAFTATPTNPSQPLGVALDRSLSILRRRLVPLYPHARVSRAGDTVIVRGVPASARATVLQLAAPGELSFFDWEADVLTPDGHTVASRLRAQDPTALKLSQGAGNGPGGAGSGGLPLYSAVRLAARQPATGSNAGRRYFLFGAPGSPACAATAAVNGERPTPRVHCLLAGPAPTPAALTAALPRGITAAEGQRLVVPPGTVVLQAAGTGPGFDAGAQFYVARERPALTGRDITDPRTSRDTSGAPDVSFGFTAAGRTAFQKITARIARRGARASVAGAMYPQHFAVALDDRLLTVAAIDFHQYPDGIIENASNSGADITGGLTAAQARQLAAQLRSGPLAVTLTPRGQSR